MPTISHDLPPSAFSALRLSPHEFAREMRISACVHWYDQGRLSQGKASEIAGLTPAGFLEAGGECQAPISARPHGSRCSGARTACEGRGAG